MLIQNTQTTNLRHVNQLEWVQQRNNIQILGERCDQFVRKELASFAQNKWQNQRLLGILPLRSYRLRKRIEPDAIIWWVEHDVPVYDHYHCQAYQVRLFLAGTGEPRIEVRSQTNQYEVELLVKDSLKEALKKAGEDAPMSILRSMGEALDP
jgi:hypothetical protein